MTRTVDRAHRAEVLDRVAAYVVERGVAALSLRPLAEEVGLSPRALLYHFGSKEAMVEAVLRRIRERQLQVFERMRASDVTTPGAICKAAWAYMTAPGALPAVRLFFETYALALRDPKRFPGFLDAAVEDWLAFLGAPLRANGVSEARARSVATIVLAGYRGFMLDFAATNDAARVGAALDLWVESLDALFENEGDERAQ